MDNKCNLKFNGNICNWPRVRIPDTCRNVDVVVGVDEAGRGPVLGSLVYCAAFWPVSLDAEIKKMGFNDSKQLSEESRDRMFDEIRNHPSIGWIIAELTSEYISAEMLRTNPVSLNSLSYDAVVRALSRLIDNSEGLGIPSVTDVFIDTVGDPEYYEKVLVKNLGTDYGKFTIEKKADATYKVVSAASIVAKVTRDTLMKQWNCAVDSLNIDNKFGSGYPGDQECVEWYELVPYRHGNTFIGLRGLWIRKSCSFTPVIL
jgi:ribonuclease H2 subunit A